MEYNTILSTLILVSEKAANIARICRQDQHLLSLLVQEKSDSEKNPRFVKDFKTLADVLVQEVVKSELSSKFPDLSESIFGEESNEFVCGEEKIIIRVSETAEETASLLNKVLGDQLAAETLAIEIHRTLQPDCPSLSTCNKPFPKNIGIWIDPIDSTAEYINGGAKVIAENLFSGLPCATVLIGVFDKDTGAPIAGVINQPFHVNNNNVWCGQHVYGVCFDDWVNFGPGSFPENSTKCVAVSSSEKEEIKSTLSENGYLVLEIPGAGYKLLSIITGQICAYVLTKPTTYYWDTCACHAVLNSLGGDILDLSTLEPLRYKPGYGTKDCCNLGGMLAYRDTNIKDDILKIININ